ncbi:hypothetical protein HOLleu_15412 [Holothuria leucospilota]|uniref:Cathepsin propeptide inhibitor domain-containing protein n=1 Tax=Holothuria leucospilota TaxID=206669 RepID=A0A9Q1HD95_HOLLE|nr:hypothetical protein HOLleu_15412 [Holothuria leucospilota]
MKLMKWFTLAICVTRCFYAKTLYLDTLRPTATTNIDHESDRDQIHRIVHLVKPVLNVHEKPESSGDESLRKRQRTTEPDRQFNQRNTGLVSKPNNSLQSTIADNNDAQRESTDFLTNQQPSVSEAGIFADPGVSPADHEPTVSEHQSTKPTPTWQEEPIICPENFTLPNPFGLAEHCNSNDLHKLYKKHWRDIRTRFQTRGRLRNTYNFRSHTYTIEEVMGAAKQIFEKEVTAFKVNLGLVFSCAMSKPVSYNTTTLPTTRNCFPSQCW